MADGSSFSIEAIKVAGTVAVAAITGWVSYHQGVKDAPPGTASPGVAMPAAAALPPLRAPTGAIDIDANARALADDNKALQAKLASMVESVNVVAFDGAVSDVDDCKRKLRQGLIGNGLGYISSSQNAVFVRDGDNQGWAFCTNDLKRVYLGAFGPNTEQVQALATRIQQVTNQALAL